MKEFLKYLGPIFLLIGTIVIAFYFFNPSSANTLLIISGVLMVLGLIVHVVVNRFVD
jgi:membrane-bound ClpP family serine protease